MSSVLCIALLSLLAASDLVAGHGAITGATGDAGGSGMAIGIDTSTPRDGTRRRPFQQDTTRFRGETADTFGETLAGGPNEVESGTQAVMSQSGDQLPQVSAGGQIDMTLHQVNADGAGPYECMINADATGQNWQNIDVTQNVPGRNSRNRVCSLPSLVISFTINQTPRKHQTPLPSYPFLAPSKSLTLSRHIV